MTQFVAIATRELSSYFRTPVGWVVTALYVTLSSIVFAFMVLGPAEPASLRPFFGLSGWLLMFLAPAVSMRLMADEYRSGSIEALMTAPVSDWVVIAGKYIGAVAFLAIMLLPTLIYPATLEWLADPVLTDGPECVQVGYEGDRPVAFLVCNFMPASGNRPPLLTHDEVVTLYHEFGHGLHQLMTRVEESALAGIHGVEWDAVELPSQFMENWCWQKEALDVIAGHYQSGEPLPDELFDKMIAAKNFQSAMQMVRQLEFSLFDFQAVGVNVINPKPLLQSDEEIAQRHIFASAASRVYVALMFEAAARYKNRQVAVGVRTAVSHTAAEEDHGVVEH